MTERQWGLWIDNENCNAASGRQFIRNNPVDGTAASHAAAAGSQDVDRAVNSAQAAFAGWSVLGPHTRRAILLKCADALEARLQEFITVGVPETGATEAWITGNVVRAAGTLREAAALTTHIRGETIPCEKPGTDAMSLRVPVGVLVGIAPWNSPIILAVRAFAMPIACGNTVVMKSSEKCPGLHRLIGDAMAGGGLPPGVLNIVSHAAEDAPEVVAALIDHPFVRRINFTGSTRVGRIIAERAARLLKPCLLELGGKSPLIVLDDADLDGAVRAAAFGAFNNQGQICMSTERVIVAQPVADAFSSAFAAQAESLHAGVPGSGALLGSVIDADTITHLRRLMQDALGKGAKLIAGSLPEQGTVMQPTILDYVTPEMAIYGEETFGPITVIVRVADDEDAISTANDTGFGLTAAIHSKDRYRALNVAKRLNTGMAHVNGPTVFEEPQMPFGGMKESGYGRFGGTAAINEFTELRWITVGDAAQSYPI